MHALILFIVAAAQEQQAYQLRHQVDGLQLQLAKLQAGSPVKLTPAGTPNVAMADAAPKNCSIPLINVLPDKLPPNAMPVKKPEGQYHMRFVTPPAPPCENWGK